MKKSDMGKVTDPLESTTAALRRVVQFVHTSSWAQWSTLGLSPTQQRILRILSREVAGVSLSFIARELGISPATASDSVGTLERKGLVLRESNAMDARKLSLSLTDEGIDRFELLVSQPDPLRAVLATLSQSEQNEFHTLLVKIVCSLEEAGHLHILGAHPAAANVSDLVEHAGPEARGSIP